MYLFKIVLLFIFLINVSVAQTDSVKCSNTNNRKKIVLITDASLYTVSYSGMYFLWYKNNDKQKFHLFNDSKEWLQMDKVGHGFSSYYITNIINTELNWAGYKAKTVNNISYLSGVLIVSTVEVFDGFYKNWGASLSDISANFIGSTMFFVQQKFWNEQKIVPKFSFHKTDFSYVRPELLGNNIYQNIFKDYNGQTYWLSVNINSFLHYDNFPDWLNIAFGYSATGMVGGSDNSIFVGKYPNSLRQREYLMSLDFDLRKIKTKNKFLKSVFTSFNTLKIPFPTIKYGNSIKFYWLYF